MNPFSTLGIRHDIVNAITELGFENPTPIQEQSIPVLLSGSNDFVGLAQTGTGKTAAFGLPLLELLDFEENYPQALILCPTRELCLQITSDIKNYAKNMKTYKSLLFMAVLTFQISYAKSSVVYRLLWPLQAVCLTLLTGKQLISVKFNL